MSVKVWVRLADGLPVSGFGELLGGMPSLLLVCIGITVMIGILHLWLSRASWDAHAWVGIWSGLACVFLLARGVQLTTERPDDALLAGKVAIAVGPYLVWALIGFGRNLGGRSLDRSALTVLAAISLAWTVGILGTPWFVDSEVTTRTDFFGRAHFSVHALWPTHLLSLYFAGALVWGVRRLRRQSQLEVGERRMLVLSFSVYAALGIAAVLTSASVISVPAAAEFGPVVVAITLSYLMAQRRRRVETQLESLLAESEERYRDLVQHAPVGVCVLDDVGKASALNPRMLKLLGLSQSAKERGVPMDSEILETARRAIAEGRVTRAVHRVNVATAQPAQVWSVTASPLGEEGGQGQALIVADDITEREALEKQLQQSRKMDSIGELVAGVAHEINNPMAYVRANLAAIGAHRATLEDASRDGLDSQAAAKLSETFHDLDALVAESVEGVERTIRIVQDMGGLALPMAPSEVPIALAPLLEESVRGCERAFGEKSELEPDGPRAAGTLGVRVIAESFVDVHVAAAAEPLRHVFDHLLSNAREAVRGGGDIHIETRLLSACDGEAVGLGAGSDGSEEKRDQVSIRIRDEGPGIPADIRSRLFDPFFTLRDVGSGTGLGLYIAYQTVRSLGGDLRCLDPLSGSAAASAEERSGACFEVVLPLA
ncbi:MAG: nitrogen regulation protein NR(II) [Myxococcota bacterium]